MSSASATSEFDDLFTFLTHERSDVRKAAAQGLAQISKDNVELASYVASHESAVTQTLSLLNVERNIQTLGDVLTALVNLAVNAEAADKLIHAKIVSRMMKLLDALDRAQPGTAAMALGPEPLKVFKELSLMLLNNLTASSVSAVHDLLQVDDDDLRGFFLGKLKTMMDRAVAVAEDEAAADVAAANEAKKATAAAAAAGDDDDATQQPAASAKRRNVQKWYLSIVLNITRSPQGQQLLCADDDWLPFFIPALKDKATDYVVRTIAAQVLRNCATGGSRDAVVKEKLVSNGAPGACVQCLHDDPSPAHGALHIAAADTLAALATIPEGAAALESLNAKKLLTEACALPIDPAAVEVLRDNVLPFVEDVTDVYVKEMDGADA